MRQMRLHVVDGGARGAARHHHVPDLAQYRDTEVLTTSQASAWLGISVKSVTRLGAIPLGIPGKERRYTVGALLAAIQKRAAA